MERKAVVFFDGYCNLCNSSVQRVIKNDRNNRFKFAALSSEFAKNNLANFDNKIKNSDSILLLLNGKLYNKTRALIRIAWRMDFPYPLFAVFYIFPYFIRDLVYDLVAKNRYKWWGKQDSCMVPTPELKEKFLS